jgi:UDP-N-acetylglucosamine:LPS N-acetylglucosamine transferase
VTGRAPRSTILLVGSSGGHLAQLHSLKPWWKRFDRVWVTFDTLDATSLLADESVINAHHPTTRNLPNLARNFVLAWKTIRRIRPSLVVSTGAGVAVPFFLLGRVFGAKTAYIEVFDRLDSATLTGRICYRMSNVFALQWPEQRRMYPKGIVIGPLL